MQPKPHRYSDDVDTLHDRIEQLIKGRDGERKIYNDAIARHLTEIERLQTALRDARMDRDRLHDLTRR